MVREEQYSKAANIVRIFSPARALDFVAGISVNKALYIVFKNTSVFKFYSIYELWVQKIAPWFTSLVSLPPDRKE